MEIITLFTIIRPPHHARLNRRPAAITVAIRVTISAGVITLVIAVVMPEKSMPANPVAGVCLSSSLPLEFPFPGWLRRADSNCRFLMQSQACCRYTTPRYGPAETWGSSAGDCKRCSGSSTCQRLRLTDRQQSRSVENPCVGRVSHSVRFMLTEVPSLGSWAGGLCASLPLREKGYFFWEETGATASR